MSLIDHHAGSTLRGLREQRGLSPEALAAAIRDQAASAPWGDRGCVDAHTIRRIEKHGHVPSTRVRFVLAAFFALNPHDIWQAQNARVALRA